MTDRLFDIEEVPEIPLIREPRARKGAAAGVLRDERFKNDYPRAWERCETCEGEGLTWGGLMPRAGATVEAGEEVLVEWRLGSDPLPPRPGVTFERDGVVTALRRGGDLLATDVGEYLGFRRRNRVCPDCSGMGSLKGQARLIAGHRCERCKHPYVSEDEAVMLSQLYGMTWNEYVQPSWRGDGWSPCDQFCTHDGPFRWHLGSGEVVESVEAEGFGHVPAGGAWERCKGASREARWRILTVHHLSGDKADCRWGNLACLCQRCHLEIQAKVVLERVWPHEHSEWFRPHAAWWYAASYLGEDLSREEVEARMDELLALERG